MSLIPLVDLAHLAALLGLRTWHPADSDDVAVLADLLARRTALGEQTPGMHAPSAPLGTHLAAACETPRAAETQSGRIGQMTEPISADFPDDPAEARAVVLLGFGETIMRFQFLEMTFFSILAIRMKKGITLDQGMAKFTGWTTQNMGRLVGTLGLPDDLKDEAEQALDARNYLVHSFMRDRAMLLHDAASCEKIAHELIEVQRRLDEFEERLEAHARSLGVDDLTDEDLTSMGLSDPNDPAAVVAWLDAMDEE